MGVNKTVRAKRNASSVEAIRKRAAAGADVRGERGFIRLGAMQTAVLAGVEDLTDWDDEELRRGRRRSANGTFSGREPLVVAKAVHDELVRRTLEKANEIFRENTEAAAQVLADIAKSEKVDPKDRIRAAQLIIDRSMGKEPQKIELSGETKWEAAIKASIVSLPEALLGEHGVLGEPDADDEDLDPADEG